MKYFKSKGAICVEMEGASIAAVCQYKNLKFFTFYYAADNLDSDKWDERSIEQLTNFSLKSKIPILALELARRIEEDEFKRK